MGLRPHIFYYEIIMSKSGIYAFPEIDYDTQTNFVVTGKTKDKKRRLGEYRTGNTNLEFRWWKSVREDQIHKAEKAFQKQLVNLGYKRWKNNSEQFVFKDYKKLEKDIKSILKGVIKLQKKNDINYKISTLEGEKDIRETRPKCAFTTERAQIIGKAGPNEQYRYVPLLATFEKGKIKYHSKPVRTPFSVNAFNLLRTIRASEKQKKKLEEQQGKLDV
tara:strand:- start:106 stop:759 length:654 start_codon:yes stop_codon:yes gene_type:complete